MEKAKPKKLAPISLTDKQREWLEIESERTGSSYTAIVRNMIQRESEKKK